MKKLLVLCLCLLMLAALCACGEASPTVTPKVEPHLQEDSTTQSGIDGSLTVEALHQLQKQIYYVYDHVNSMENVDFSVLSIEELMPFFYTPKSDRGLYELYETKDTEITGDEDFENGSTDPLGRFDVHKCFDGDLAYWILTHLFPEKEGLTRDTCSGENFYFHKEKMYQYGATTGGWIASTVVWAKDFTLTKNGHYLVTVEASLRSLNEFQELFSGDVFLVEASYETDETYGDYWRLYNIQGVSEEDTDYEEEFMESNAWREAYKSHIEQIDYPDAHYYLIDIDANGVPELYIDSGSVAGGSDLIYYDNGIKQKHFDSGSLALSAKIGEFLYVGGRDTWYYDEVFSFDGKTVTSLAKGNKNYIYTDGELERVEYQWNGTAVTKEEYELNLHRACPQIFEYWPDNGQEINYDQEIDYLWLDNLDQCLGWDGEKYTRGWNKEDILSKIDEYDSVFLVDDYVEEDDFYDEYYD